MRIDGVTAGDTEAVEGKNRAHWSCPVKRVGDGWCHLCSMETSDPVGCAGLEAGRDRE